jgi:hypothetical protein
MPHDKNGRLIEPGDVIRGKTTGADGYVERAAVVQRVLPDAGTCDVVAVVTTPLTVSFTAKDVEIVLKANGSTPE